jgi:hypothetical protein
VDSEEFDREVVMLRNDLVKYDRRTGELELGTFQGTGYKPRAVGGGFYFFNESLTDIVARLSRDFDRKVVISDLQLAGMNFYAFFTNGESLLDILHTLNADGSMLIEEHREAIYITPRKKQ